MKKDRYTNFQSIQKIRQDFTDSGCYSGGMSNYQCILKLASFYCYYLLTKAHFLCFRRVSSPVTAPQSNGPFFNRFMWTSRIHFNNFSFNEPTPRLSTATPIRTVAVVMAGAMAVAAVVVATVASRDQVDAVVMTVVTRALD